MKNFWEDYLMNNLAFWVCTLVAIILLAVSFFIPPVGYITPEALKGVAELFAFASLGAVYKAIDKGTTATVQHGGTSVTIGKDAEESEDGTED